MAHFEDLSRVELLKLIHVYAKYWLANDGCFFLGGEEEFSNIATELDVKSRKLHAASEARRLLKAFEIPLNGGLKALEKALHFRLYTAINRQKIEWVDDYTLTLKMLECRLQKKRRERGLPDLPCKKLGLTGFREFAKTVDARIKVKCVSCPPDPVGDSFCAWEFTMNLYRKIDNDFHEK
jgi:hypothetical protein